MQSAAFGPRDTMPGVQTFWGGQVLAAWAPVAVADRLVRDLVSVLTGTDPGPVHHCCPRCGSVEHGRPYVDAGVDISVAHAPGLTVVAVSRGGRVGVDVEAGDQRSWVRTEAVAKAHGTGIVVEHSADSALIEEVQVPEGFVAAVALLNPEGTAAPASRADGASRRTGAAATDR